MSVDRWQHSCCREFQPGGRNTAAAMLSLPSYPSAAATGSGLVCVTELRMAAWRLATGIEAWLELLFAPSRASLAALHGLPLQPGCASPLAPFQLGTARGQRGLKRGKRAVGQTQGSRAADSDGQGLHDRMIVDAVFRSNRKKVLGLRQMA